MKKFYIIALLSALLLSGRAHDAYAQTSSSCIDLSKAKALAAWAVSSGATYSNDNRACSSGAALSGAPSGSPSSTGYCTTYDCSSFATWILRQIPGQAAVPAAPGGIPSTYIMWGSNSAGPQNGSPNGMKPCDPTKQPVCLGLTEFGEGGQSGPGHVVTALCGKVYSASPPLMDNYATPVAGTSQSSSEGIIVWITPFGLENASMNSCSSSCSPSATAGLGGAGLGDAGASGEMNNMMMDMMMGSMEPMMSAMGALSALGSGSSTPSSTSSTGSGTTGSTAANTAAADAASGTTASGAAATGTSGSGTTGSSSTVAGGFSSLVSRLSSMMSGTSGTSATTSGAAAAAATTPTALSASSAEQDVLNVDQEAADETPLTNGLTANPAAADPTADYHDLGLLDHRLSCSLTAGATVASCRSATAP